MIISRNRLKGLLINRFESINSENIEQYLPGIAGDELLVDFIITHMNGVIG